MNDTDHVCNCGGYLVGASFRLGTASEFQFEGLGELVGCSRLKCRICDQMVKNLVGRAPRPNVAPASLHVSEDARTLTEPTEIEGSRLYFCRCQYWIETSQTCTAPTGSGDVLELHLPWRCSGHPELDLQVDGIDLSEYAKQVLNTGLAGNDDWLVQAWRASGPELRLRLKDMLLDALAHGKGAILARALAVAAIDTTEFRRALSSFRASDSRLLEPDPTRPGWRLLDRLGNTVARAGQRASDWSALRGLAIALYPASASRLLQRAMIQLEPAIVEDALAESAPLQAEVTRWRAVVAQFIEEPPPEAQEHAGIALKNRLSLSARPAEAAVALQQAVDSYLTSWIARNDDAITLRMLEVIESLLPARGFERALHVLEHAPDSKVRLEAMRALEGYYVAPPRNESAAFQVYVSHLHNQMFDPICGERALRTLALLGCLDITNKAAQLAARPQALDTLMAFFLTTNRNSQAARVLSALYDACLATRRRESQQQFLSTASVLGWALTENLGNNPSLTHPNQEAIELNISETNRQFLWSIQVERVPPGWLYNLSRLQAGQG